MTWTDERLGALLTATFESHESDVDPGVAMRIAASVQPRPRRWPAVIVAAAVVAVVATLTAIASTRHDATPLDLSTQAGYPAGVEPQSSDQNVAATKAEAQRLLDLVSLPPGSVRRSSALAGFPRSVATAPDNELAEDASVGPAYWIVPGSPASTEEWIADHPPSGLRPDYPQGRPARMGGDELLAFRSPATAAHGPAYLSVMFHAEGTGTAVRIDPTVSVAFARTAQTLVPLGATVSITEHPYSESYSPTPPSVPRASARLVTNSITATSLIAAYDRLRGGIDAEPDPCTGFAPSLGGQSAVQDAYGIRFQWAGHSLSLTSPRRGDCTDDVALTLDGTVLTPTVSVPGTLTSQLRSAYLAPAETARPRPTATTAQNVASARAEVARVLATVQAPDGSARLSTPPTPYKTLNTYLGPADSKLTRSEWWQVPMGVQQAVTWLEAHRPAALVQDGGVGGGRLGDGSWGTELYWDGNAAPAYGGPALLIDLTPYAGGTAMRATVFIDPRTQRPHDSYVPAGATVSVTRTTTTYRNGPASTSTVTGEGDRRLVRVLDGLGGSPVSTAVVSCGPAQMHVDSYRLDVTWAGHQVTYGYVDSCVAQVTVRVDGRAVHGTLDPHSAPGKDLATILDGYLTR